MSYKIRVSSNPDAFEPILIENIVYGDYIETTNGGRVIREKWQNNKPTSALIKTTAFSDFILLIGEDSYETLSNATQKKAKWIMAVWRGTGIVDPNDSRQMAALVIMRDNAMITAQDFTTITT